MKLHLGENIREFRKRLGITQEQLADRLGVSFQSISRWENNTTYPDMEKLPELAQLFDTTVDILLGYGEKEEKKPIAQVQTELLEAFGRDDWEECVRILRMIRYDYVEEMNEEGSSFLRAATMGEGYKNPAVMEELRLLTDMYFQRGTNGQTRAEMVQFMAEIEDDEHIENLIKKYTSGYVNLQKKQILQDRYHSKNEYDKYHECFYPMRFEHLQKFLFPPCALYEASDPENWCRVTETKLKVLNCLSGITPTETHPISGDGEVDIFVCRRLEIAEDYVTQLCGCGRYEQALLALEDMAELLEKFIAMPNGTIVPNSCLMLSGLVCEKNAGWVVAGGRVGSVSLDSVTAKRIYSPLNCWYTYDRLSTTKAVSWFTKADFHNERTDTKWLDPMREHPRFLEAVRRMDECSKINRQDGDYTYIERSLADSFNKGRQATGKEVKPRSH